MGILKNYYSGEYVAQTTTMKKQYIQYKYPLVYKQLNLANADDNLFFYYSQISPQKFSMHNKIIPREESLAKNTSLASLLKDLEDGEINKERYVDTRKSNPVSTESQNQDCSAGQASVTRIRPDDIKIGLNGYLESGLTLVTVWDSECSQTSKDISVIVKEISVSLCTIIAGNLLQDVLFSLLNNKDMLDIIKYESTPKSRDYRRFEQFFTTFDCDNFHAMSSDWRSFESNSAIRSWFVADYRASLDTQLFRADPDFWFYEYMRQTSTRLPRGTLDSFACRHKLILSEYMALCLLCLLLLVNLVVFFWICGARPESVGKARQIHRINSVSRYLHTTFLSSVLFIYYYNLISFCSMIKYVRSVSFGMVDFWLLFFRGKLIVYPLFQILRSIQKARTSDDSNSSQNPVKKSKKKPKSRVDKNAFTTKLATKRIHAFWTRKKDQIRTIVRISYDDMNSPNPKQTKKQVILNYNLQVVNDEPPEPPKPVKPEPSRRMKLTCRRPTALAEPDPLRQKHTVVFRDIFLEHDADHESVHGVLFPTSAGDNEPADVRIGRSPTVGVVGAGNLLGVLFLHLLVFAGENRRRVHGGGVHQCVLRRNQFVCIWVFVQHCQRE